MSGRCLAGDARGTSQLRGLSRWAALAAALALVPALMLPLSGCAESQHGQSADAEQQASSAQEASVAAEPDQATQADDASSESEEADMILIQVNGAELMMQPADNASAEAFVELLGAGPLTLELAEYGGFEKVGSLGQSLPANDERITTEPGDVILYQGSQITLQYGTNSWSYTRLGRIEGRSADELREILGAGDVTATFSLAGS